MGSSSTSGTQATTFSSKGREPTSRPNKRHKLPFRLPGLGQPGGLDDPLRVGLSGAEARSYLRLLHEGLAPEEAKAKTLLRKGESKETKKQPDSSPSKGKRGSENLSPLLRQGEKKARMESRPTPGGKQGRITSFAAITGQVKMAVLPKDFPEVALTTDQQTSLEEAILDEVVAIGSQHNDLQNVGQLRFAGIHFRVGMILIDCVSQESANWLVEIAPKLKNWQGPELVAVKGENIPKGAAITVFLPRSKGKDTTYLLSLIQGQNFNVRTSSWRVINSREEGHGQVLTIGIDLKSKETIDKEGHILYYRYGTTPVSGLRRDQVKEVEKMETDPPASTSRVPQPEASSSTVKGGTEGQTPTVEGCVPSEEELLSEEDGKYPVPSTTGV